MKDFKTFKTIQKYLKLYENQAAGVEDDPNAQVDDTAMEEDPQAAEAPAEAPVEGGDEIVEDPTVADAGAEEQANPEDGIFISDIKKAEFAKLLISALMNEVPQAGSVPDEMLNVSTENADEVIKYIQNLLNLDTQLSTDNENNEDSFANAVKGA